jgi:hypothetical protein
LTVETGAMRVEIDGTIRRRRLIVEERREGERYRRIL